jgi:hypothetical protein
MFTEEEKVKLDDPMIAYNEKFKIVVAALSRGTPIGSPAKQDSTLAVMVDTIVEEVADLGALVEAMGERILALEAEVHNIDPGWEPDAGKTDETETGSSGGDSESGDEK